MYKDKEPVDIVYTWVNGEDKEHLIKRQKYAHTDLDLNPERFRDIYSLLKYSIRSVEKYLPWHQNIHILTDRPQVPDWINSEHPNVYIHHHDEVIPEKYLPTFNSNVIQSFLHCIPGLSEHFIYLNDDFLFYNEVSINDFWRKDKYVIFNTLIGENLSWRIYSKKHNIYRQRILDHGPLFAKKEYWKAMVNYLPEKMEVTRQTKFRQRDNLVVYKLYRYYMLSENKHKSITFKYWEAKKINYFHMIRNTMEEQRKGLAYIKKKKPKFICLNDDQLDNPNEEVIAYVQDFLEKEYPVKSSYEL